MGCTHYPLLKPLLHEVAGKDVSLVDSAEAMAEVQAHTEEDLSTAVILTIPSDDPAGITANLRGPLLMNPRTRLCKQVVLSDEMPTRHPLFPLTAPDATATDQTSQPAECPV